MRKLLLIAILLLACLLLACSTSEPSRTEAPVTEETAPVEPEAPVAEEPVPAEPEAPVAEEAAPAEPEAPADDASAISFSLTTLQGDPIDQSFFAAHKLTMVNYWATWCGPCVGEIPDLVTIADEYAEKGFAIIGVLTWDEDIDGAKAFITQQGVNYPIVVSEGYFAEQTESFYGIPTTFFVDGEGRIVSDPIVGSQSGDQWRALIDALLSQVG